MVAGLMRVSRSAPLAALVLGAGEGRGGGAHSTPPTSSPPASPIPSSPTSRASKDGKVTPQSYCECVAGKFSENKLSQTDVDMLDQDA